MLDKAHNKTTQETILYGINAEITIKFEFQINISKNINVSQIVPNIQKYKYNLIKMAKLPFNKKNLNK